MPTTVSTAEVKKAAIELALMKRSLSKWLRYRALNDAKGVAVFRSSAEQNLANKLYALLSSMFPGAALPAADLSVNPQAAVQLANIALTGQVPVPPTSPATSTSATGLSGILSSAAGAVNGAAHPWLWPVLIVGGLLVVVIVSITSSANLAAQQEQDACIEAGACTDYGFWLKWAALAAAGYFAWTKLGVGDSVRGFLKKGGA